MNKLTKEYFLIAIASLVVGFLMAGVLKSTPKHPNEISLEEFNKLKQGKDELLKIYQNDLQDYQNLQTMKERYESANDILAKIMTVFLADLSLRISKDEISEIFRPLQPENDFSPSSKPRECPKQNPPKSCPSLKQMAQEQGMQVVPQSYKVINPNREKKWVKSEEKLDSINSEADAQDFLKSVEIENFFDEIKTAKNSSFETIKMMEGKFSGTITFDNPERPSNAVDLKFENIRMLEGKPHADYEIKLSRDGEPYSNSNGNGGVTSFKNSSSSKNVLFLELGGRSGFMQLYFLNNTTLIGNYYRKLDLADYKKEGTVKLNRLP